MAATSRYVSPLAEELAGDALDRFVRYARIDTQSSAEAADAGIFPSTEKQLDLSRLLVEELEELGLENARIENATVRATVPATVDLEVPPIGLIAHVDTSPQVTGANVDPQVVRGYDGGEIVLPRDPSQVLRPEELPELRDHVGCDLVTTDGTTLLGADDKAGVAEIMAAVAHLVRNPAIPHGPLELAFTPDEEVGHGTDGIDLASFGAVAAYTLDGSTLGELQNETFSAASVRMHIHGRSTHPGFAKGEMVNAVKLAGEILARLPKEGLSPETTDGRQGFVHPHTISGDSANVELEFIVRDFDDAKLDEYVDFLRRIADEVGELDGRARVEVDTTISYRNMKSELDRHPDSVAAAEEAIRRLGLEPKKTAIRGGTDGSRLTELGLPTPNIFTGGQEFHSEREWLCVQDMGAATEAIVHLAQVWAERA